MAIHPEKILRDFGRNMKKLREERGFSTRQFADEAEIAHSAVTKMEAGRSNPTLITLLKVAEALNVNLEALVKY